MSAKTFKELLLTDAERQNMINLLKEEGLSEEQINNLSMIRQSFSNPRGLNQILFDVSGCVVNTDDWDANICIDTYLGKMKSYSAKRKVRQMWGTLLHEQAFRYLKERLEIFGWNLKYGQTIEGKEYDCIGWKEKTDDIHHPDLAIEMHFPIPKKEEHYELPFVIQQTRKMREKLKKIDAEYKYVLVGVPQNKTIRTLEIAHSDIKVVYQRHKFVKIELVKRSSNL